MTIFGCLAGVKNHGIPRIMKRGNVLEESKPLTQTPGLFSIMAISKAFVIKYPP